MTDSRPVVQVSRCLGLPTELRECSRSFGKLWEWVGWAAKLHRHVRILVHGGKMGGGCAWHSDVPNVRLFCYLPSVFCLPMWHSNVTVSGKSTRLPGLVHVLDRNESNDDALSYATSPNHQKFHEATFDRHMYCSSTGEFFQFRAESYYCTSITLPFISNCPPSLSLQTGSACSL